jgi:hypothetical protein
MSRHYIDIESWPHNYQVIVGWDPGLSTYFAQVEDTNKERDERSVVWIGTFEVIDSIDVLEELMNAKMPDHISYGYIPKDIKEKLKENKSNNE